MLSATKTVATEHVYRAKNNSKCVCSLWGLRPGPHVELTAFPEDPSWIGEAALGLGISQKISTGRSIAKELIPFWRSAPARVDPN